MYLITRGEFEDRVRIALRDLDGQRWSDVEMHGAVNDALAGWVGRVSVQVVAPMQWQADVYEYALPDYVRDVTQAHWQDDAGIWHDLNVFHIHEGALGGQSVELGEWVGTRPGRLFYWIANGPYPIQDATLTTTLASNGTSALLSATAAPEHGYLHVGNEWVQWAGVERGATVTLLNLRRGVFNSTAASHASGSAVDWGIAMPEPSLVEQLMDQVAANLHLMYLQMGAAADQAVHERAASWYQQRADLYWRRHAPRAPGVRIARGSNNGQTWINQRKQYPEYTG